MNIVVVTTSCSMLGPGHHTGLWLEEFAVPFTAFSEAGASIRVVSPKGGAVPIDPKTEPTQKDREKWPDALKALTSTERLAEVAADPFDAVFIPGGHGPMVDLVNDQDLQRLLAAFDREGKMIAAVCHGPAALLNVRNAAGEPLVKGRKVTGFTNVEERLVMLHSVVPFLLEDALKERGANFESALLPFFAHVVRDENLITGQNPASTTKIAEELIAALQEGSSLMSY
jgi:putative intracellular protease/amidase